MKLTVLVDNNTIIDQYLHGEPAVSYYIESGDLRLLFDAGYSNMFLTNSDKLGINLTHISGVVLSHGHIDHTLGLRHYIKKIYASFPNKNQYSKPFLLAHPYSILKKIDQKEEIGCIIHEHVLQKYFHLKLTTRPVWLNEKLLFLGEIKRLTDFEAKDPIGTTFVHNIEVDDYLFDDTALVYKAEQGLVIITGCSHAGICNIIEQAKAICKDDRILDIIGGLHLLNPSKEQLDGTLEYLKNANVSKIHACHCTDLHSKIALSKYVALEEVGSGLTLSYT